MYITIELGENDDVFKLAIEIFSIRNTLISDHFHKLSFSLNKRFTDDVIFSYAVVWPHAIRNCVPVRIIHTRDLSNSSITLNSKGHTRLFSRFHLVSNMIRPACVAPHVIETEKKNRTDYRLPGTDVPTNEMEYIFQ